MATERVRVWAGDDRDVQHFAAPPEDQTSHTWRGTAVCGVQGDLHWIHGEVVDQGATCDGCLRIEGTHNPLLEGDYPGPV